MGIMGLSDQDLFDIVINDKGYSKEERMKALHQLMKRWHAHAHKDDTIDFNKVINSGLEFIRTRFNAQ